MSHQLNQFAGKEMLSNMERIRYKATQQSVLNNISINHHTFVKDETKKSETLIISGFVKKGIYDQQDILDDEIEKIVGIIVQDYNYLKEVDHINVRIRTGFNIGIASYYENHNNLFTTDGMPVDSSKNKADQKTLKGNI